MNLIIRKKYLNEMISFSETPDNKGITDVRRSGKSVLLRIMLTVRYNNNMVPFVQLAFSCIFRRFEVAFSCKIRTVEVAFS